MEIHPLVELEIYLNRFGDKYNITINGKNVYFICREHGSMKFFKRKDININQEHFCPVCAEQAALKETPKIAEYTGDAYFSKPEQKIEEYLKVYNIEYERQKEFPDCKNIKSLPFDFHVPSHKLVIEFDGSQHFRPTFNGAEGFKQTQKHDKIKNDYCTANGINILRLNDHHYNNGEIGLCIKMTMSNIFYLMDLTEQR